MKSPEIIKNPFHGKISISSEEILPNKKDKKKTLGKMESDKKLGILLAELVKSEEKGG